MWRSLSTPVIKDDLLYIADVTGRFRCLNAKTGEVYWTYDLLAGCWGSALVVDGKVFIGDEDGDIRIFRHSADPAVAMPDGAPLAEIDMGSSIYSTPIAANGVLYIANRSRLFAIVEDDPPVNGQGQGGNWPQWRGSQGNGLSQESEVPLTK